MNCLKASIIINLSTVQVTKAKLFLSEAEEPNNGSFKVNYQTAQSFLEE